jgi:hypothetical protein
MIGTRGNRLGAVRGVEGLEGWSKATDQMLPDFTISTAGHHLPFPPVARWQLR